MSSDPRFTPSNLNCTPATPTLSDALAVTETVPLTVPVGEESETNGGVVSEGAVTFTVIKSVAVPPDPVHEIE